MSRLCVGVLLFLTACHSVQVSPALSVISDASHLHAAYLHDKASYEDFFSSPRAQSAEPIYQPIIGGILPHHLFVGHEIARYYETLRIQSPSVVVIIGPNHFDQGKAAIQLTDIGYKTPYGTLGIASAAVQFLTDKKIAAIESSTFDHEHSISTHVAFVKRMFPRSALLPIILKVGTSRERAMDLGKALAEMLPKDTLVLASVDFSHYQPPEVAAFHDEYSKAVIEQFATDHVRSLELDSAPSIEAFLTYMTARKAQHIVYSNHTNSADFIVGPPPDQTTSHFFMAFSQGIAAPASPFATLLFLGDTIIDRGVQETIDAGKDPLKNIRGTENRFFRGTTLTGLNLEGPITSAQKNKQKVVSFTFQPNAALKILKSMETDIASIANNHIDDAGVQGKEDTLKHLKQSAILTAGYPNSCIYKPIVRGKMALCAFADLNGLLDRVRAKDIIRAARLQADYVVISIHWGQEYSIVPSNRQRLVAKEFVEAGADAIIGHGPHVVQPVERIQGKPVLYSIGNFLFDQPDQQLSDGIAAALTFTASKIDVWTFPLYTAGGMPRLEKL